MKDLTVTYFLRVHFEPQTACVDLQLSGSQYTALVHAMRKHDGSIKLKLIATDEVVVR